MRIFIIKQEDLIELINPNWDDMFEHLKSETKLPIGYIDVVLWKGAQNHLIKELNNGCKN